MFFHEKVFCDPSSHHLAKTVLMRGHNICFHLNIRKIIFQLSSIPPHIWNSIKAFSEISCVPQFSPGALGQFSSVVAY